MIRPMKTPKRQNLSEMVAAKIKRHIMDNALKAGDRLPTEQEFATRFGVSRISVREATKALGFLGILRAAPRRGLTVGEVDMKRVTEYLGFHIALNDFPKIQLLETRLVLELGALSHIMRSMAGDPALYPRLKTINDQLAATPDSSKRIELDIHFHRELLESSGIKPLVAFNDLIQIFFDRFRQSVLAAEWERGIRDHSQILDALRDGDLKRADELMRAHLEYHKRGL
jgi:GntR family transcriptional repressor for pyruvate dehydrogenase complex